ncbi:MAG: FlgD immunoglobulin-like domain containing protein [Candidatus Cloacimonadales bacterium]|nr:FlgD immunoglobulin-like domain containing protein [Candidatus Cloacimonadales bacterium]
MNYAYYRILNEYNHTAVTYDDDDEDAVIVLGHARKGTGGKGSHPFWMHDANFNNGVTYTFMHNGAINNDIKDDIEDYLVSVGWFDGTYNGTVHEQNTSSDTWIDSEMLFHYFMKFIMDHDGNVYAGIHDALTQTNIGGTNIQSQFNYPDGYWLNTPNNTTIYTYHEVINFVLSDGQNLYTYRNSPSDDVWHELSYKEVNDDFYAVKTLDPENSILIDQFDFVTIPREGDPFELPNFKTATHVSGTVSGSWTLANSPYFIVGDITVNSSLTIGSGVHVFFLNEYEFEINGNVTLQDGAFFSLSHSSDVIIEDGGLFTLEWGSTIIGYTPTTYEATPPGHIVGAEHAIPGDRIIAQNGGIITTNDKDYFLTSPGDKITIKSLSGHLWDGIFIKNPEDDDDYWFVNCDISGIRKLSIENVSASTNIARLNLYLTDFHDAGQIVTRNGHWLTIEGSSTQDCYIQNNEACPIYAYESPVFLDYVLIGGEGNENNSTGIYLYESSSPMSTINNCDFLFNNGAGLTLNGIVVSEFTENNIVENTGFGMLCYPTTEFFYTNTFNNIVISDNGYAEYIGWEDTYEMQNPNADITISESSYGTGSDQYLLMNLNWNGTTPVDISGTNITSADLPHLFPSDPNAWSFGGGEIPNEKLMLYSASSDIGNGDYTAAEQTLQSLISTYPLSKEAGTAVYYLYHLESLTDKDFSGLREYLENISTVSGTSLEMAIKKIITKTYMKDKEYLIAIDLLETVIANSQLPDEVIAAMIDEGYCYLELSESEERGLPVNCTIQTATLDEYQAKVRELESQFSFYPDEENENITPVAGEILSLANYPNPFNPSTTIAFSLSSEADVEVTIYNVKGQQVKQLVNEQLTAGKHTVEWSGKDNSNKSVASGIYYYKITAGKDAAIKKMLLLK